MSKEQLRMVTKSFAGGDKFKFDRSTPSGRTVTTDVQPRSDGGFVVTISDVTELRKREAIFVADRNAAREDAKRQQKFLKDLGEEIKKPVKDLIGKAELLAKGELDEKQKYLAQTVIKSGLGVQAVIGSALLSTRDQDGEVADIADRADVEQPAAVRVDEAPVEPQKEPAASEADQKPAETEAEETIQAQPRSGDVAKILIAEDNVSNQEVFLELLEGHAYEVTTVQDGREAVVQYIADSSKFDVIVMDLTMPNMGGVAATEAIRAHEQVRNVPKIPIIGVSAFATDEHREQAMLVGMNEYLTKPLDVDRFFECLAQCASERRLQDLKEKAQEMAGVSGDEELDAPLSIADLARKYQSS